jgi:hypothetical protein
LGYPELCSIQINKKGSKIKCLLSWHKMHHT